MTTLIELYHWVLLVTIGDLFTEQYTSIKQITVKIDFYSVVILKSYFYHLVFHERSIRVSRSCK